MEFNGEQKSLKQKVKGPYRKIDPIYWKGQGESLISNATMKGVQKWKWVRFLK